MHRAFAAALLLAATAIAIGCTAEAGTINATHRYNMP